MIELVKEKEALRQLHNLCRVQRLTQDEHAILMKHVECLGDLIDKYEELEASFGKLKKEHVDALEKLNTTCEDEEVDITG